MTSELRSENMEERAFREELPYRAGQSPNYSPGPTYAGLDLGSYPGDRAMADYNGQGFTVACVYLANRPGRIGGGGNMGWINAVVQLSAKGWGSAPTYVGAQASLGGSWPPVDPLNNALVDAAEAVKLAHKAGYDRGHSIFLDVEAPFLAGSAQESYALKWIDSVQASGFKAALYCFPQQIDWAKQHDVRIWTVHLNSHTGAKNPKSGKITWCYLSAPLPVDPIDAGALGTQGRFYCRAAGHDNEIDYDCWMVPDPSKI